MPSTQFQSILLPFYRFKRYLRYLQQQTAMTGCHPNLGKDWSPQIDLKSQGLGKRRSQRTPAF